MQKYGDAHELVHANNSSSSLCSDTACMMKTSRVGPMWPAQVTCKRKKKRFCCPERTFAQCESYAWCIGHCSSRLWLQQRYFNIYVGTWGVFHSLQYSSKTLGATAEKRDTTAFKKKHSSLFFFPKCSRPGQIQGYYFNLGIISVSDWWVYLPCSIPWCNHYSKRWSHDYLPYIVDDNSFYGGTMINHFAVL